MYGIGEAVSFIFKKLEDYRWTNTCISNYSKSKKFMYQFNDQVVEDFALKQELFDQIMFRRGL
jgi:hypothetical protein